MTYNDIKKMSCNKFELLQEIMQIEENYKQKELKKHSRNNGK